MFLELMETVIPSNNGEAAVKLCELYKVAECSLPSTTLRYHIYWGYFARVFSTLLPQLPP